LLLLLLDVILPYTVLQHCCQSCSTDNY